VQAGGDLVRRADTDGSEAGFGEPVVVLGEGQGAGDASDRAAAFGSLGGGEVVLGQDVGDAEAAAWAQDAEALGEDGGLVAGTG
jgi:hypothetical protein